MSPEMEKIAADIFHKFGIGIRPPLPIDDGVALGLPGKVTWSEVSDPKSFGSSLTYEADEVHCTGFEYLNTHHVGDGPNYSKLTRGKFL